MHACLARPSDTQDPTLVARPVYGRVENKFLFLAQHLIKSLLGWGHIFVGPKHKHHTPLKPIDGAWPNVSCDLGLLPVRGQAQQLFEHHSPTRTLDAGKIQFGGAYFVNGRRQPLDRREEPPVC